MAKKYKSRHKGSEIDNAVDKVESLAPVATTGSYNDLTDKPDISSGGGGADITVDESLSTTSTNPVQNKVITTELNKKGTYSKPSDGIPKSDLASDVQESLGKADTALQSFEEQYKGTVTSVKINGSTKNPDADGLVDLGNVSGGEGGSAIVDEALSDTSTNPVQNKAIAEALNQKFDKTGGTVNGSITVNGGFNSFNTPLNTLPNALSSGINVLRGSYADANMENADISFWWTALDIGYANKAGTYSDAGYRSQILVPNTMYHNRLFLRRGGDMNWFSTREFAFADSDWFTPASGIFAIDGSIKANDYLDAYGISLYETFATKTELGDINAVLDAINGEVI